MVKQATQTKEAETNLRTSPNDTVFWLRESTNVERYGSLESYRREAQHSRNGLCTNNEHEYEYE